MDHLWYLVPGGLLMSPFLAWRWMHDGLEGVPELILVAVAWGVGFLFHQWYRTVFEKAGGYDGYVRKVNRLIYDDIVGKERKQKVRDLTAHLNYWRQKLHYLRWYVDFLRRVPQEWSSERGKAREAQGIWEEYLYNKAEAAFHDHNRRQWHYYLSFQGGGFAALFGLLAWLILAAGAYFEWTALCNSVLTKPWHDALFGSVLWFFAMVILLSKAYLTGTSLEREESYHYRKHQTVFLELAQPPESPEETNPQQPSSESRQEKKRKGQAKRRGKRDP